MKVIFLKNYSNKKKGHEHDLTDIVARELIEKGICEQVEMHKKTARKQKIKK